MPLTVLGAAADVFVGLVLVGAAFAKALHWTAFKGVVGSYRLLPEVLVIPFAFFLPPVEIATGLAAALRAALPWSLWAAAALFIVFAIAMALNLLRGRTHIDCGCFQSALRQPLEWRLVVRNVVLALLAACSSLASDGGGWSRDVALMAVPAGITLYALYTALNTVWALDDSARTAFPRLRS